MPHVEICVCLLVPCASDRIAVELAACLPVEFRADPHGMMAARLGRLHSLLASFGMTPSDRTRVAVPEPVFEDSATRRVLKYLPPGTTLPATHRGIRHHLRALPISPCPLRVTR